MDARVPKQALSMMGYEFRGEVIPSYVEFSDIFTLTLGTETFWGNVEKRTLVSCSEPTKCIACGDGKVTRPTRLATIGISLQV